VRRAGATKGRDFVFGWGLFGGNCGTAIGMGSGWTGDGLGAGPGVGAGEKEVGVGAQVRSRRVTNVSWVLLRAFKSRNQQKLTGI
jgi:hypothetical protein